MINDEVKWYGGMLSSSPSMHERGHHQLATSQLTQYPHRPLTGGNFRARVRFPKEYPLLPPQIFFQDPIPFHPNIYPHNGELCISILHAPEEDKYGYESAAERWSPVQTPETILLSVISLFASPNDESPANPEAAKLMREERNGLHKEYRKRCRKCVRESLGED